MTAAPDSGRSPPDLSVSPALQRIVLSPHAQFRGLFKGLLQRLYEQGAALMVVQGDAQRLDYWRQATRAFAGVRHAAIDSLYRVAREPVADGRAIVDRARKWEERLGVTINHLSVRDRHLGRGYALGGYYHPRSRISEEASYVQTLAAFVAECEEWDQLFDEFGPTLVVNCGEIPWRLAREKNIPYRVLAGSRYKGLYQWAHSAFLENPDVGAGYDALLPVEFPPVTLSAPYNANALFVSSFARKCRIDSILRTNALQFARHTYWRLRRYDRAKGYLLSENLAHPWRVRAAYRHMKGPATVRLAEVAGRPFVFYPLHTEPEAALQGLSPEYMFQLETIVRLARELPAGYLLAVKDTPVALGRRPRDFYGQIAELKNVVILNIEERGVDVVNAATAIATITGTAGFEGAIIGKPVISFGRYNLYNILPHVHLVNDHETLKEAIRAALDPGQDREVAKRNGARFLAAVEKVSFDLAGYNFMKPEYVEPRMIAAMLDGLCGSLNGGAPAPLETT